MGWDCDSMLTMEWVGIVIGGIYNGMKWDEIGCVGVHGMVWGGVVL